MTDKKIATPSEKEAALQNIQLDFTGTDSEAQRLRLLAALRRFPVTTYEARRWLDVYWPPARIFELRKQGHPIVTHWQTILTEAGEKHRVGLYALALGGEA